MKQYKNTGVYYASNSALGKALSEGNEKQASTIFKETTANWEKQVPNAADRAWLMAQSKSVNHNSQQHAGSVE